MTYSVPKEIRDARTPVFCHAVNGEPVFVKQRRVHENPLGLLAQRILYSVTGNILLVPPEPPEGNPVAFEAGMLRRLAALGIKVPRVLHEEEDYFVMSHAGVSMEKYVADHPADAGKYVRLAMDGLRRFHGHGLAHGGALMKNFTILDGEVHFIDFETKIPGDRLAEFQVRDVFLFILSLERHGHNPDLEAICAQYDGRAGGPTLAEMRKCLLGLRIVKVLDIRLLRRLSMRDIRSLSNLVAKAEAVGAGVPVAEGEAVPE